MFLVWLRTPKNLIGYSFWCVPSSSKLQIELFLKVLLSKAESALLDFSSLGSWNEIEMFSFNPHRDRIVFDLKQRNWVQREKKFVFNDEWFWENTIPLSCTWTSPNEWTAEHIGALDTQTGERACRPKINFICQLFKPSDSRLINLENKFSQATLICDFLRPFPAACTRWSNYLITWREARGGKNTAKSCFWFHVSHIVCGRLKYALEG